MSFLQVQAGRENVANHHTRLFMPLKPAHGRDKHSLWDGVLRRLDLAEELLRYAVVKGELAVQHCEQDHAESPHVTGFTAVRPPCRQEGRGSGSECDDNKNGDCTPTTDKSTFLSRAPQELNRTG